MENPEKQIVPWYNRAEFECVYEELFHGDLASRKHGLGRIEVWKFRVGDTLATAIECTLLMMNAQIMDETVTNTIACSIHSMALIRYINLLTEKYQMSYHQPVNRLTNRLGIPKWIVELRHEASHSAFPPLSELQEGTKFALKWLKTHYWKAQLQQWHEPTTDELNQANERELNVQTCNPINFTKVHIAKYRFLSRELSNKAMKNNKPKIQKDITVELDLMKAFLQHDKTYINYYSDSLALAMVTCETTTSMYSSELHNNEQLRLPYESRNIWYHLVKMLGSINVLSQLSSSLMELVKDETKKSEVAASWCRYVSIDLFHSMTDEVTIEELDYKKMLDQLIDHPCSYSEFLIKLMFSRKNALPQLRGEDGEGIIKIMQLYLSSNDDIIAKAPRNAYFKNISLKRPKMVNMPVKRKAEETEEMDEFAKKSKWKLSDASINWSQYKLGTRPGQTWAYNCYDMKPEVGEPRDTMNEAFLDSEGGEEDEEDEESVSIYRSHFWTKLDIQKLVNDIELF